MFVPNFKILGTVVPEKSLTKKKVYTHSHRHTEKPKTIYTLYTSYTGGIIMLPSNGGKLAFWGMKIPADGVLIQVAFLSRVI